MGFFSRPQEQKKSAKEEQARAGKLDKARDEKKKFSLFKGKDTDGKKGVVDSETQEGQETAEVKVPAKERFGTASEVILRPRVTEKSTDVARTGNAYVFEVRPKASKQQIAAGIKELYGVEVLKVHTARVKAKNIRDRRGRKGVKSGGKKAYVYLKRGDTIEFV